MKRDNIIERKKEEKRREKKRKEEKRREKKRKGEKERSRERGNGMSKKNLDEIEDSELTFGRVNNKNKVQRGVVSV